MVLFALKMCVGPGTWFSLPFPLCLLSGHATVADGGVREQPQGGLPPGSASHTLRWQADGGSQLTLAGC